MDERRVTVLLIEDDDEDALLIREWLAGSEVINFSLEWVRTYEAALDAYVNSRHDVYLVDYRLGPHSGVNLIRDLVAAGCVAPLILLTGVDSRAVDLEAMEAGATDYLPKTQLNVDTLERAIRHALERKSAQIALQKAHDDLDLRVQERTAELTQANETLRNEIAERRRVEKKLRQSERLAAIATAAAKLAHEIGNPLNGLSTTVQVLDRHLERQKPVADEMLLSTVQDLKHELSRLQSLLQKWRTLARPPHLNLQLISLAELIDDILRTQASYYAALGVELRLSFPPELPRMWADPESLALVVLNLCKNAIEAMPQGGLLTVCSTSTGDQVLLEIRDSGVGISEELNVFEPFTTTKETGTGLGLAIVQQIVDAHEGHIKYTSAPGQGTTFIITLPVTPMEKAKEI